MAAIAEVSESPERSTPIPDELLALELDDAEPLVDVEFEALVLEEELELLDDVELEVLELDAKPVLEVVELEEELGQLVFFPDLLPLQPAAMTGATIAHNQTNLIINRCITVPLHFPPA